MAGKEVTASNVLDLDAKVIDARMMHTLEKAARTHVTVKMIVVLTMATVMVNVKPTGMDITAKTVHNIRKGSNVKFISVQTVIILVLNVIIPVIAMAHVMR